MSDTLTDSDRKSAPAFLLASLITSYPLFEYLEAFLYDNDVNDYFSKVAGADWNALRGRLITMIDNEAMVDDLRSDYIDIFDRGRNANPLYETEYGRQRAVVKGNELADIAGFYKAFGFELGDKTEMLDHVSIEFEFYALLLMKQVSLTEQNDLNGLNVVSDARKKFINDHLGRFVGSILRRPGVFSNEFYTLVFKCCNALVQAECANLGVKPDPATWVEGEPEPAAATACGGDPTLEV
ncbi:MAG: molecular chaperone TorD family protein [Bdellovibrionota bacterium]